MLLSQLLHIHGVESVVLERHSREYVLSRIRAGVLEDGTVQLLRTAQASNNLDRYGERHSGIDIVFRGEVCKIKFVELTGGSTVTVYGQTDLTKDLYEARDKLGGTITHETEDVTLHELDSDSPSITYAHHGEQYRVDCDFVVGCDGYHGVSRKTIPDGVKTEYESTYPFGWLGVLSETPPVSGELIYVCHERGFALCSMRSSTRSRYYIQVPAGEDIDQWSDEQFWEELKRRLPEEVAKRLITGPSIEKSIAPLRSFVCEPMRWKKLFLAGDAAHIVPPTGAKGLNLAASDVYYLYHALLQYYQEGSETGLSGYSDKALRRVWQSSRFSWALTKLLHDFYEDDEFKNKLRQAEFNYLKSSRAAQISLAENYVGLPY